MNHNRYLRLRGVLFLKGVFFSFLGFFVGRDKNRIIFSSEFNTEFNHNSKYLFLYFLEHHKNKEIRFIINNIKVKNELNQKIGPYFIDTHSIKNKFYVLRAKTWVVSSLETPLGGVLHNYKRYVFHLGHGAPLKKIGRAEKNLSRKKALYYRLIKYNFSYFFSTSDVFSETWRACLNVKEQQILISGQARNETLQFSYTQSFDKFELNLKKKNILYAPTWRPFEETTLFPFLDFNKNLLEEFLIKNNIVLYIRLHPNFEAQLSEKLYTIKNISILSRKSIVDVNEILGQFDLLITDYSSIYIDFLLTSKPILFLPYDYQRYKDTIGFSISYQKHTPGPMPVSQEAFLLELDQLIYNKKYYLKERIAANNKLNIIKDLQSQHNADLILNIID